jgi:hypothetical protein
MTSTARRVERLPNVSCDTENPSVSVPPHWAPACPLDRGAARLSGSRSTRRASLPVTRIPKLNADGRVRLFLARDRFVAARLAMTNCGAFAVIAGDSEAISPQLRVQGLNNSL